MHRIRQVGVILLVGGTLAGAAAAATSGTKLSLVAYSTPKAAYAKLIPAFQKTAAGKGVTFTQSYGASGDQSRAVASGLPADVVALLARARHAPGSSRPGIVAADWNTGPVQGHRHRLGRRPRRPQGQPEAHQDLGRPRQAGRRGDHAEPVHLGRRALEHHGRLRRPAASTGKTAEAGARLPQAALPATSSSQDKSARDALNTFTGGKGDVLDRLRERGDHRAAEGPGGRLRHPGADDPDREPGRGHDEEQAPDAGAGVRRLPADAGGAEDLRRRTATARSSKRSRHASKFPTPPGLFTIDSRPRRLDERARRSSSTRRTGMMAEDRAAARRRARRG